MTMYRREINDSWHSADLSDDEISYAAMANADHPHALGYAIKSLRSVCPRLTLADALVAIYVARETPP